MSSRGKRRGIPKHVELFKTEMCHFLMDYGNCPYGERCQYAHQECELRVVPRSSRYKTQICRQYKQKGMCPYGRRCQFIHTSSELYKPQIFNKQLASSNNNSISNSLEVKFEIVSCDTAQKSFSLQSEYSEASSSGSRRLPIFVLLGQGKLP
eukprot:TRINITY_DN7628_c0_g1_i2.p3 TRINITY_DN7628_c0_g1~~TRINITY_DN7628_c0_g1_i2.p3  ORF type:complete len:164 (+),score=3.83 TRINITY_DN7628_c0_g1_i2:37-492(+)